MTPVKAVPLPAQGAVLSSGEELRVRGLTTDFSQSHLRPYFLWDEDLSVDEVRRRLQSGDDRERLRLLAKILREARDIDVWSFVTLEEVADALPRLRHRLGRRRAFWEFLIEGWRRDGILSR